MKILYIISSANVEGSTISVMNLIKAMKTKGVDIVLVVPEKRSQLFNDFLSEQNLKFYTVRQRDIIWPEIINWKSVIKFPYSLLSTISENHRAYQSVLKIAKNEKPDIIHTNVGPIYCGYMASQKLAIPHVWHLREYQTKDFGWHIFPSKSCFERKLHRSNVITITEDIKSYFRLSEHPSAHCIYNGILHANEIKSVWPKKRYFITANNLYPAKSMDITILGFAGFLKNHPDYELIICGGGDADYIKELKQLASDNGCTDNIKWLGSVDNVIEIMSEAMGLIVSSRNEGFGRMTAEACFMGTMPIGRNTAGTKEILDRTGGMRFDTPAELTDILNKVVSLNQEEYKAIVDKAQKRARELYSIESNVNSIFDLYCEILSVKNHKKLMPLS